MQVACKMEPCNFRRTPNFGKLLLCLFWNAKSAFVTSRMPIIIISMIIIMLTSNLVDGTNSKISIIDHV